MTMSKYVTEELKQKQAITDQLINNILYSGRLLVDHVEALEQCMLHLGCPQDAVDAVAKTKTATPAASPTATSPKRNFEIFTARNTCLLLGSTILEHFLIPKSLRLTMIPSVILASGFGAMYVVKNVFVFRNKMVRNELNNLIRTIDEFGNCIRRNMTYFNEIIVMKQHELIESRQIERAWDCITAAKEVTEILYDATRKLETEYPIHVKYAQYYSAMEELRECEYFKTNVTDYSPKHIKDFYNIFAYVQSQFLLRLALAISTKPSLSQLNVELVKIDCLIRQLVQEEENHFKNLALELNKKKQLELEELNANKTMQGRSGPVAVLQDSSLKLSACMVAVAGECQALDITLQRLTETEAEKKDNARQLVQVANNMRSIENALSVCFDDFQRLMIVYNKFLNSKLDDKQGEGIAGKSEVSSDEEPESFLRVEISQNSNEAIAGDDFYAYMFDEKQAQEEEKQKRAEETNKELQHEREILNFEKRITKGKFRPVLKQLKNRIDPIRQVMLEKEREVLASKGINVDELFGEDKDDETAEKNKKVSKKRVQFEDNKIASEQKAKGEAASDSGESEGSDSEGSADLEFKKRSKILKEQDNFAEMRNFLAQKQAINIFKLGENLPSSAVGSEDILESEC